MRIIHDCVVAIEENKLDEAKDLTVELVALKSEPGDEWFVFECPKCGLLTQVRS